MSTVPSGRDVVVIEIGSTMTVMLRLAVDVSGGFAESATCTVKLKVPPAAGDPEIEPSGLKLSPGVKVPPVTFQIYGAIPPEA